MTDPKKALADFLAKGGSIRKVGFGVSGLKCEGVKPRTDPVTGKVADAPCKATGAGMGITRKRALGNRYLCFDCVAYYRDNPEAKAALTVQA